MKEYLKDINKSNLKLKIDSFIEEQFIDIIDAAKVGENSYSIKVEQNLIPHIQTIRKEIKYIFNDCKVYVQDNMTIVIYWT
jgi:hypothetical protein